MEPRKPDAKASVFMNMAYSLSRLSKDPNTQHGALIVDHRSVIVSQGYNGPPRGIPDNKIDWARPAKYPYVIHAEDNAIHFGVAARGMYGLDGCTLYVTGKPCSRCMLNAVRAKLGCVVYGPREWGTDRGEDWQLAARIAELGNVSLVDFALTYPGVG